jgi:monoamine oxidase
MAERGDVIVVGAGVAGLAAAVELSRAGLKVILLEARDRIGGRILTVHPPSLNFPVELGAEFIHGLADEIWDIVRAAGLDTHEVSGEMWCKREDRLSPCSDFLEELDDVLGRLKRGERDRSFTDFLEECNCKPDDRDWAYSYVEGFHASFPERISVNSLVRGIEADHEIDGERAFRILRGYDALVYQLHRGLREENVAIHLNSPVSHVEWCNGEARIRTSRDEEFTAARAIITLPLGVFKNGDVEFSPELEMKRTALEGLAMGMVVRVVLQFRRRFWDDLRDDRGRNMGAMSFLFSKDPVFPTWWSVMPAKAPLLTGWAAGHKAEKLMRDGSIESEAVAALGSVLGVERRAIEEELETCHVHDWQADPFSHGAYSYAVVGGENAANDLAAPVEGTLFFAGEATDYTGHNGTVHGAIRSGRRAAKELLEIIRSQ